MSEIHSPADRPNVLFIMADDHRHDAIAACGNPCVRTPHLDGLIGAGTHFRRNYMLGGLSGAVCVPARAALHTGSHPFRASVGARVDGYGDLQRLRPDKALMAETFRQAGYHTFATGKWHNCRDSFARSFADGANIFFGGMSDHDRVPLHDFDATGAYPKEAQYIGEGFSSDLFADAAIDFLKGYNGDAPFFLYLSFTAPHDPRTPPEGYAYDPVAVDVPPNFVPEHLFDNGDMRLRDEVLADFPRTEGEVRQHVADYYGMIEHMDAKIGQVLAALEASGRADDTIVVYTADHGLAVGQHGLMGKQNMYEHSVSVPLVVRGKSVPCGRAVDALSLTYDIYPTLCDLAGIEVPESVESRSLLPLMESGQAVLHETVYSHYKDIQRMVCDGRWKLIRYYRSEGSETGTRCVQLFDLENDPWEMDNLSEREEGHAVRLRQALDEWMRAVGDPLLDAQIHDEEMHVTIAEANFSLSEAEMDAFRKDGYLGPFDLCSEAEMADLRPGLEQVLERDAPDHGTRVHNRHLDSPLVYELSTRRPIVERMQSLYGPDLLLWRTNFFVKEPGAKEIPWHQDHNYWPLEPPIISSAWIAIDEATVENSCVQIIPGSHRKTLPHIKATDDMVFAEMGDPDYIDTSQLVNLEMKAGQFVLFNERTVHHSEPNRSQKRRIGLAVRVIMPIVKVLQWDAPEHALVQIAGEDRLQFNRTTQPPV